MTQREMISKMIERRVSKGNRLEDSQKLFAELVALHTGDSLVHALVYESYATEKQAERFVATVEG